MTRTLAGWTLVFSLWAGGVCGAQGYGTPAQVNGASPGGPPAAVNGAAPGGVAAPATGGMYAGPCCNAPCAPQQNCWARLCGFLTYRALPQSAASSHIHNVVPTCSPPVWAFFAHDIEPPVIPASAFAHRPPSVAGGDLNRREDPRE